MARTGKGPRLRAGMEQTEEDRPTAREETPQGKKPHAQPARRKSQHALVEKMIEKIEEKLDKDELKPSVGDLIRLLQLDKELKEEQPKEIKVSWVEPHEEEHAGDR